MKLEVLSDAASVARYGAALIAVAARASAAARGQFVLALSGGHTPWQMLRDLAAEAVPWQAVRLVQVDERFVPAGNSDRNLTHLRESLLPQVPLPPEHIYAMPVEEADRAAAAARYAGVIERLAGTPPVLDLVHLGLGADGHTASLVPGDPVLDVAGADVAITRPYQGHVRMTLTFPILNRSRQILFVVTGADKAEMLLRLRQGDPTIPAGRIRRDRVIVLADIAAAGHLKR